MTLPAEARPGPQSFLCAFLAASGEACRCACSSNHTTRLFTLDVVEIGFAELSLPVGVGVALRFRDLSLVEY